MIQLSKKKRKKKRRSKKHHTKLTDGIKCFPWSKIQPWTYSKLYKVPEYKTLCSSTELMLDFRSWGLRVPIGGRLPINQKNKKKWGSDTSQTASGTAFAHGDKLALCKRPKPPPLPYGHALGQGRGRCHRPDGDWDRPAIGLAFCRVTPALSTGVKWIKSCLVPMDLAITSYELHGMLGGESLIFTGKR